VSKRYVLLASDVDLTEGDLKLITEMIKGRHDSAKVIPIKGNPRAVIVKTSNTVAPLLREERTFDVGSKRLVSVLTSGAIGNLKKRATEEVANGKVS
jgi:hypothetical protein